jgi:Flp pilus assembly protein CpaB
VHVTGFSVGKKGATVKRQSLMLVIIGVVLFIAGGGIAFVTVNNSAKKNAAAPAITAAPVNTPAVVVTANVPAGTTGQDMVARGLVSVQLIPQKTYVATDLPNLQGLSDQVLKTSLVKGQAIQSTDLTTSASTLSIPAGLNAISVTTTGVGALAGYLQPGSNVDVYANIGKLSTTPAGAPVPAAATLPCTELTMTNIEVLDVSQVVPALNTNPTGAAAAAASAAGGTTGRTIPSSITLLLAVSPAQAREITFMTQNETLSVAQTQKGTSPPPIGQCVGTGQFTTAP